MRTILSMMVCAARQTTVAAARTRNQYCMGVSEAPNAPELTWERSRAPIQSDTAKMPNRRPEFIAPSSTHDPSPHAVGNALADAGWWRAAPNTGQGLAQAVTTTLG